MDFGDWITIAIVLLGYLLAGLFAFFNLRERVALLEQFNKAVDAKLDKAMNKFFDQDS